MITGPKASLVVQLNNDSLLGPVLRLPGLFMTSTFIDSSVPYTKLSWADIVMPAAKKDQKHSTPNPNTKISEYIYLKEKEEAIPLRCITQKMKLKRMLSTQPRLKDLIVYQRLQRMHNLHYGKHYTLSAYFVALIPVCSPGSRCLRTVTRLQCLEILCFQTHLKT